MLGWLAVAAAPLLIHLWSRHRFREAPWAAMQFLLAAMRKNARRLQLQQWLLMAVQGHYAPAFDRVERFLCSVGRRKFLKPIYTELMKTPEGRERARAIYAKARPGYHPIAQATVDGIVGDPRT